MQLIIGLGNPGAQYERTRHNVGFHVVDTIAEQQRWKWERRGRALLASGTLANEKVVLVKPLTFMNKSGEAVSELVHWYKVAPDDILVVYDDLDLPTGKVRLRANGSAGGHNGLSSIIQHLHTNQFPRLRVGIGRPANAHVETINYVLGIPTGDEHILLATGEDRAANAIPQIVEQGVAAAMNLINPDPEDLQKAEERRRLQREQRAQMREQKARESLQNEQSDTSDAEDNALA